MLHWLLQTIGNFLQSKWTSHSVGDEAVGVVAMAEWSWHEGGLGHHCLYVRPASP